MTWRVLITDNDLGDSALEREILERELGAQVHVAHCATEAEVLEAVNRIRPHALLVQWAPITARVLNAAQPELVAIARFGIGIDMIDTAAARDHGVTVDNVPDYCIEEVATHSVALALALWRRLPALDAELRDGQWAATAHAPEIRRLSQSTVGLIGLGRIGSRVAAAFDALGARVIVSDPIAGEDPYPRVGLAALAAEADLVLLHAPLVPATRHIVGRDLLAQFRRRPIIVNTSRGGLIDTEALVEALTSGQIAGAGLDVFEEEPLAADHPIRTAPNTLITAHAAWASDAALPELRERTARAVVGRLGALVTPTA